MKAGLVAFFSTLLILSGITAYFKHQVGQRPTWDYPREQSKIWDPHPVLAMVNKEKAKVPYHFAGNERPANYPQGVYHTDEWRKRITPHSAPSKNFLALFGCSMIFGQGLDDSATLPYFMGQTMPEYRPYNFGVNAYGPHHLLAWLESGEIKKQISEAKGIGIYSYITDHVYRLTRSHGSIPEHAPGSPYYTLDKSGVLRRDTSIRSTDDKIQHRLVQWIGTWPFFSYFGLRFPKLFNRDYELFCAVVDRMRGVFEENFPGSPFFVLFHPTGTDHQNEMDQKVRHCLKQRNLSILEFPDEMVKKFHQGEWLHIDHLHPSAIGNAQLAQHLTSAISNVLTNNHKLSLSSNPARTKRKD